MSGNACKIKIMNGDLTGREYEIPANGLRLGRSSSNDVSIPDEELSRNHCLFEKDASGAISVLDLASANGTYVNGELLDSSPRLLHDGDKIEVGATRLVALSDKPSVLDDSRDVNQTVISPNASAEKQKLDLGLGDVETSGESQPNGGKRRLVTNILWGVTVIVLAAAIALVFLSPNDIVRRNAATVADPVKPISMRKGLETLSYEKVEADSTRIFRYAITIDDKHNLKVAMDDIPGENRHVNKSVPLSEQSLEQLSEIFRSSSWQELDEEYSGQSSADDNTLKSWRLRTVMDGKVKQVVVVNTIEPPEFARVRDSIETFFKNELGIWAIQYSRDKLVAMSAESEASGDAKWDERDVEYGNLSAAIKAYREAIGFLDTVSPKPENYYKLKEKLEMASKELQVRYEDQRFRADQAINMTDWVRALEELRILRDMFPDTQDPRHAEAERKLMDVEKRMRKAKKGGR